MQRFGSYDPTCRKTRDSLSKAFHTPEGPCTLTLSQNGALHAEGWGPGADWAMARLPRLFELPAQEISSSSHPWLEARSSAARGLRVGAVLWVGDTLINHIFQQRVSWRDAANSFRQLVQRFGAPAPGPLGLRLAPRWADLNVTALQAVGLDLKRARALLECARHLSKLQRMLDGGDPREFLRKLPGVGPWTTEMVMGYGFGDPDAAPTGDLHLPRLIGLALQGRPADDPRMLELLEPYRGARFRVMQWLYLG